MMSRAQRRRTRDRRRNGKSTYDGVSDAQIYRRDEWLCQMPDCYCPAGRAIPRVASLDPPWRASIDHKIRLADGGTDDADNKRAAHARCNAIAGTLAQGWSYRLAAAIESITHVDPYDRIRQAERDARAALDDGGTYA